MENLKYEISGNAAIQFGMNLTSASPGSVQRTYLIVSNIEAVREALVAAGVDVGEIFHFGPNGPLPGPDPEHGTYRSFATFSHPDSNTWLLQESTTRLPGRIDSAATSFGSASDLASPLGVTYFGGRIVTTCLSTCSRF